MWVKGEGIIYDLVGNPRQSGYKDTDNSQIWAFHSYDSWTWAEAEGPPWLRGQPKLLSETLFKRKRSRSRIMFSSDVLVLERVKSQRITSLLKHSSAACEGTSVQLRSGGLHMVGMGHSSSQSSYPQGVVLSSTPGNCGHLYQSRTSFKEEGFSTSRGHHGKLCPHRILLTCHTHWNGHRPTPITSWPHLSS